MLGRLDGPGLLAVDTGVRELGHGANPLLDGRLLTEMDEAVGDRSGDRFELFDAVRTRLIEVTNQGGLLVVLDDLQWADEATLSLLSFLSRHAHRNRILTVAAFRDVHIPPPLAQLTGGVEVITLERLADEDSADLADAVAAGRLGSQSVSDVVRRAGGNPLFVRELTRLVATGRPPRDEPFQVPGGVREVVAQRLARLSPACRTMLDIAAVLGREVRLDIVARIVGEHEALPDLLTEAVGAKILMTPIDSRSPLVFAHDLFREVLSAMLSTAHKAQLHLTVARTMDELHAEGASLANSCVARTS